jgi:hypothetical protein
MFLSSCDELLLRTIVAEKTQSYLHRNQLIMIDNDNSN